MWIVILPDCMLNTWFYLFTENEVMPAPAEIAANQPSAPAEPEREVSPRPVSPRRSVARAENVDEMRVDEMRAINQAYVQSKKSKSSLKKQHATTNRFMSWLRSRGEHRPLKDIPVESLDQMLSLWLIDLRQANGTEYEPNSLQSYLSAIKCHLNELGIDIKKLDMTSKVVVAKKKELKSLGKGNLPNRAAGLSIENEERLWESGALGDSDPEALVHTVWFLATKCLGFRGCHEARQLKWGDLTFHEDNGCTYLEWNERLTKTRSGDSSHHRAFMPKLFANPTSPEKCPIRLFQLYAEHRPQGGKCDAFFLGVNWNRPKDSSQWYLDAPMGVNRLSNIMSRVARRAGLAGKFTNHSVRRTMCNQLFQRGVKSDLIAQLSGHKNVGGLTPYTVASGCQQQGMSLMLQHANVTRDALAAITGNPGPQCQQGTLPSIADSPIAIPGPSHVSDQSSACVPSQSASRPDSEHAPHVVNIAPAQQGSAESLRGLMGLFSSATFNAPVTVNIQMNEN